MLPSLGGALVSSSSLFFSTAGVLKGARCGSESKGGEGVGGGAAAMLGRVEGMSRVLQHVQGNTQPLGVTPRSLPSLSTGLQAPGKGQGRDDKLFQVSPGKQGRERVTGVVATATSP